MHGPINISFKLLFHQAFFQHLPPNSVLLLLMCLTIFSRLIRFSNSLFVFCLHSPKPEKRVRITPCSTGIRPRLAVVLWTCVLGGPKLSRKHFLELVTPICVNFTRMISLRPIFVNSVSNGRSVDGSVTRDQTLARNTY